MTRPEIEQMNDLLDNFEFNISLRAAYAVSPKILKETYADRARNARRALENFIIALAEKK